MDFLFGWIIFLTICGFVAGAINLSKGRSFGEGFLFGLVLEFIGVIIVMAAPKNEKLKGS
jgi:hypothetical protein